MLILSSFLVSHQAYSESNFEIEDSTSNLESKIAQEGEADVIIVFEKDSFIDNLDESIESDVLILKNDAKISKSIKKSKKTSINLEDKKTLQSINGFSGTISSSDFEALKSSGQKFEIYEDRILELKPLEGSLISGSLNLSTSIINANYSWNVLNITGRNVTIAVIDTGIEYTHSNLGGCLGVGCRVLGGYDFVNSDSNPMDDNGHGTHVAGIIGANGSVRGVAFDANFYALKACTAGGSCSESNIISSIDWAINNSANIISISIGGYVSNTEEGNSGKDPLSLAVDNAVSQGLVVVISAGNDGSGVSTINTPGSAENVITVCAANDANTVSPSDDSVASFSSRGPSAFGRLDPDLCAPGVNIVSTYTSNTFQSLSGTSMAAPFVSGSAALLIEQARSQGKNITPMQIRSILIGTSRNLSGKLFEKGAGMIDLESAMNSKVYYSLNYTNQYGQSVSTDRWEFVASRDSLNSAVIIINNSEDFDMSFNVFVDDFQNMENNLLINSSSVNMLDSVNISSNTATSFSINFSLNNFDDFYATTYGTILTLNGFFNNGTQNVSRIIKIPLVVSVPIYVDATSVYLNRTMSNYPSGDYNEDVYFYAIYNSYSRNTSVSINWSNSGFDLDLFLYNSTGNYLAMSAIGSGTSETINTLNNGSLKWIRIDGYDFNPTVMFNLNITDLSHPISVLNYSPPNLSSFARSNATKQFSIDVLDANQNQIYYHWSIDRIFNLSIQNFTFNSSNINKTNYLISVLISNNPLNNRTNRTVVWNITIDDISPIIDVQSPSGNYNSSNISINFSVSDAHSGIDKCWYSINGSSNTTIENCQNTSILVGNGMHSILIYANDTVGNIAFAQSNFTVGDLTPPVINNLLPSGEQASSTTSVVLSLNTDENATCKYDLSNYSYVNMTYNFTSNSTNHVVSYSVSSGNSYQFYVRCSDMNNNSNTEASMLSFSVAVASSGGSSGGGGSGGGSSGGGAPDTRESVSQNVALIKDKYSIVLTSTKIPISQVSLNLISDARNVKFTVTNSQNPPVLYAEKVYSYIEIDHENLVEEVIKNATINFKVNKTWLTDEKIEFDEIKLLRYYEKWTALPTMILKNDSKYVYYSAQSPGLSLYAISIEKEIFELNETKNDSAIEQVVNNVSDKKIKDNTPRILSTENNASINQNESSVKNSMVDNKLEVIMLIALILILIYVMFFRREK